MLSKKSLEIIKVLFSQESNLQLPVAVVEEIIEIRKWVQEELSKENATTT